MGFCHILMCYDSEACRVRISDQVIVWAQHRAVSRSKIYNSRTFQATAFAGLVQLGWYLLKYIKYECPVSLLLRPYLELSFFFSPFFSPRKYCKLLVLYFGWHCSIFLSMDASSTRKVRKAQA